MLRARLQTWNISDNKVWKDQGASLLHSLLSASPCWVHRAPGPGIALGTISPVSAHIFSYFTVFVSGQKRWLGRPGHRGRGGLHVWPRALRGDKGCPDKQDSEWPGHKEWQCDRCWWQAHGAAGDWWRWSIFSHQEPGHQYPGHGVSWSPDHLMTEEARLTVTHCTIRLRPDSVRLAPFVFSSV